MVIQPVPELSAVYLAVYDGHGGATVSNLLQQMLHRLLLDELLPEDEAPLPTTVVIDDDVPSACSTPPYDDLLSADLEPPAASPSRPVLQVATAFANAYARMDAHLRSRNCLRVGATAVTLLLRRVGTARMLTVANCGDARAVLCRAGRPVHLTQVHRPADDAERSRVECGGGFVMAGRVNGVLNVARAFGDHCMKSVVVSTPAVSEVLIGESDDFVVLACDGLWDFVDDASVVRIAQEAFDRGFSCERVADELVKEAIFRRGTDNVSVIVLQFDDDDG